MGLRRVFALTLWLLGCFAAGPAPAQQGGVELLWYGQAAFRIGTPTGKVILIDPFISNNPVTPEPFKDLSKIGQVDLILVTHGHGDHVGDAVALSEQTGAPVAMNADMASVFKSLGLLPQERLIGFNKSGTITPLGQNIRITMVPAEHSSTLTHTDPDSGRETLHPGGEPAGYIIELENGFKLYHAGDTGVFSEMAFIGDFYRPDLALLPIGGHYTMDPQHAADAVRYLLKPKTVIPMHYGTFPVLTGTPEQFQQALGKVAVQVIVMSPGETRTF